MLWIEPHVGRQTERRSDSMADAGPLPCKADKYDKETETGITPGLLCYVGDKPVMVA